MGRRLLLSPRSHLLFCRSCASYLAGCCDTSPHAVASLASASTSCCAIASRSSALAPLVRLVVVSPSTPSTTPAPPTPRKQGAARAHTAPIAGRIPLSTTLLPPHPAPALVPPGNGVSKLPLCWHDTGLEGQEQRCRRRTVRRGAVSSVIVVDCAIEHPPRPSACMGIMAAAAARRRRRRL